MTRSVSRLVLGQYGRRTEEDGVDASGPWGPGLLHAAGAPVARNCLAQRSSQRHHQQSRKNAEGRWFDWPGALQLSHQGPFFLREQLGFRGQVRDRTFRLIQGELVLQAPSKNRHRQRQQAERKQESATAFSSRIARLLQACSPITTVDCRPAANRPDLLKTIL
jgi:hypothetical protein